MTQPETLPLDPKQPPDEAIPLESPMPHLPSMDTEEPELASEADIPPERRKSKPG